jgi:hypothetical protein
VYTLQWGESTNLAGLILEPPMEFLKFPLRVGDKHKVAFDFRTWSTSYRPGRMVMYVEVEKWEDIEVPAGRFRALKIVAEGRASMDHDPRTTTPLSRTWWYAPEVSRFVKHVQRSNITSYSEELTSYKLVK